jgi:hypothetical protein
VDDITKFDPENVGLLGALTFSTLESIAAQMGLEVVRARSGKYSETEFTVSYTFRTMSTLTPGMPADFPTKAMRAGLPADSWGKTFIFNSRGIRTPFTISDIKPRNTKYPILARNPEGKNYKFSVAQVMSAGLMDAGGK